MSHVFAVSTADCNRFVCGSQKCYMYLQSTADCNRFVCGSQIFYMYLQSLQQTVTGLFAGVKNVTCICSTEWDQTVQQDEAVHCLVIVYFTTSSSFIFQCACAHAHFVCLYVKERESERERKTWVKPVLAKQL